MTAGRRAAEVGTVAILGAGGFIGSRMVERWHLAGRVPVRPVVRRLRSVATIARFDLEYRVADALDRQALARALEGCDVVVHAVAGSPRVIRASAVNAYVAAQAAGVRRLVYLSTASVHGQAPEAGTDEASALPRSQPLAYNRAKAQAEAKLRALRERGAVELVVLRPGIVLGPRSRWITEFADRLLRGEAGLLMRGAGICNGVYVDNVLHAVELAMSRDGVDRETFLVGDAETVTWADVYRPLAAALGFELDELPEAEPPPPAASWRGRWDRARTAAPVQAVLSRVPAKMRAAAASGLGWLAERRQATPWRLPARPAPAITLELALLYRCAVKLPHAKATRLLGFAPPIAFEEAMRRTVGWLAFAGYPVVKDAQPPTPS